MRRFLDENGTFEIKVPATWKHSIKDGKVHTFQEYEIWKSDAFQLSVHPLDTQLKNDNFLRMTKELPVEKIDDDNFFRFPSSGDKGFTTESWVRQFGDSMVIFSLTFPNNPDPDLDNRTREDKLATVHSIFKSFRLIEAGNSADSINSYRFDMFLQGVGATALILSKAIKNKAFIEATCLLASQIDALLRIGIVLKTQIVNSDTKIESEWIYQGLSDKKKSEKDIYKKALDLGVIDQQIYDGLFVLYDDRNRVIHRFIISEITLAEVEEISYRYYQMQKAIAKVIYDLESDQIKLNVGMTKIGDGKASQVNHLDYIKGKIGKQDYFDDKK